MPDDAALGRLGFDEILPRIADLAEALNHHHDPTVVSTVSELLDWIDAFHVQGIGTLVAMIREWRGEIFLESVATHPVTGLLLDAYGLGSHADVNTAQRAVQAALAEVRPYLASHGGDMEVVAIQDGLVRLRLHGMCDGCTGAEVTLTERVEVAMREHWIDFRQLESEAATAAAHPPPPTPTGRASTAVHIGRKPSSPTASGT